MGPSGYLRLAASAVMAVALSASLQARDPDDGGEDGEPWMRRSTWELSTSLTFQRYLEPFERVSSAHACRNRCVRNRRCTGWTYYDATFGDAGEASYRLQRVCVLGAGLKERTHGSMPGRTSGVVNGDGPE
jgi:PAN domain-containing protein